jgi:PAS domain S-box-containing protein
MGIGVSRQLALRRPSLPARAYLAAIVTAGAFVLITAAVEVWRHPPGASWYVLLILTAMSGSASVRLSDLPVSVSLSDTFTLAAALVFGADAGTLTVAVDALAMSRGLRGGDTALAVRRTAFNVTAPALSLWAASHLAFRLTGLQPLTDEPATSGAVVLPLLMFGTIYFFLNTGAVALIVALENDSRAWDVWRDAFAPLWPAYVGGACLAGVLAAFTAARAINPMALALVLALVLMLHLTYGFALSRLHRQVEQLQTLASYGEALRSTAEGVIVVDLADRVSFLNNAASQLTGWDEAEARGLVVAAVYRVRPLDNATAGVESERLLVTRAGASIFVEQRSAPVLNDRGERIGTVITFRDIAERKALEAERADLLRREQAARSAADAANAIKDEFLRSISHELRTPATAVLGWARVLRDGRLQGDAMRKALESLDRSAAAQASLVETLIGVAQSTRGTLALTMSPVDVRETLREAVAALDATIRAKALSIAIDMPDSSLMVMADERRLYQAVWHVLANAIKFSTAGGQVQVHATEMAGEVAVDVRDHGAGIDPAVMPFLFEGFRQGDGSTTRAYGGLGIGLTLVRHIIELHGGSVAAQSAGAGRGTVVTIRLPSAMREAS